MEKLNKAKNKLFITSLIFTIMLIVCVPMIVIFAGKNWILMTMGIIFAVLGFYGTPIAWVQYGEISSLSRFIEVIEKENILSVSSLATHFQLNENIIKSKINKCIEKGYLTGFIFDGKILTHNEIKKKEKVLKKVKCENCGANLERVEGGWYCPYCYIKFKDEEIND